MADNGRRNFLTKYFLHQAGRCIGGFEDGLAEAKRAADLERFFESYESSYALTLAYPDEILLETARAYGIDTENRSKEAVIKELFIKKGGF